MIAQPTPPISPAPTPAISGVESELQLLRTRLDDALNRIVSLEQRLPAAVLEANVLFPLDAPVMEFAKALCAEIFPGPVTIKVACAPDDPSAQWYVLLIRCSAEITESIDRELQFGRRLVEAFPAEAGDIRLAVSSE